MLNMFIFGDEVRLLKLYIFRLIFFIDDISRVIILITLSSLSLCCCVFEMYFFKYPSWISLLIALF